MDDQALLAEEFDQVRGRLRAIAARILGSTDEADDAVQESWLRASRAGAASVANVPAWLTTIVSRVCLDLLRARQRRREEPIDPTSLEPVMADAATDPEQAAMTADAVGLALLAVLDRLSPAERVAFVLHDLFAVPFDEIAGIVGRSTTTTKKLASRARHRVHGGTDDLQVVDLARQRAVVTAFLSASRAGDLDALLAVLAPDVVRRADALAVAPGTPAEVRGARAVAEETRANMDRARLARPALVDGTVGAVVAPHGMVMVVLRITTVGDRVTAIEVIGDPARLRRIRLGGLLDHVRGDDTTAQEDPRIGDADRPDGHGPQTPADQRGRP
ncbi:sigma-70 family RNA polymerase sigma factor [Frankia gtarii]|uniref:sigma-70 family RNA polymerase sigma factor n=1 Tax=Frankia gtarii TaxID=2950102 RepID=UPI0021C162C7|nr:sigma-70 family RNA polymerase sigma factor [Frankia gtarii]